MLREATGRGGSTLVHRIFAAGRTVFAARPSNHFPLHEDAPRALLFGGGIGITPLIPMAHRLHRLGRDFTLHHSAHEAAPYWPRIAAAPWAARARLYLTARGARADLPALMDIGPGARVYACGPDAYMTAVMDAAAAAGVPETHRHIERFTIPEVEARPRHPFVLRLADGREVGVEADEPATDALMRAGVRVEVKCADGALRSLRLHAAGGRGRSPRPRPVPPPNARAG